MRSVMCLILAICVGVVPAFGADHVLIIGGVAGEKSFYDAFWEATSGFHALLTEEYGYSPDQITFLFEDMESAWTSDVVDGISDYQQVLAAFGGLSERVAPSDRFLLFMLGHASRTVDGSIKFNLRGRDITESEYVDLIRSIPTENQVLIFGFPYSGRFVPALSGPGRLIVTSSSANEGYSLQAGFGNVFVDAFSEGGNDVNGDGDVSVLEAFVALEGQTAGWYESNGSIQSEHPHLDDNGDGRGSRGLSVSVESDEGADGVLAEQTFLGERVSVLERSAPSEVVSESVERQRTALPYDFISDADERAIAVAMENAPSDKVYPDDGAVVLWESVDVDIDEKSRYVYSMRRVVKIFNEDGFDLAEVSIPYMRGKDDVTIHHARTVTAEGQVIDLDMDEVITDVPPPSAVDAGLYVDARLMYFRLPEVADGCIIDYAYSTNNLGHVMRGEFWRKVYFQGSQPVRYYRFSVHIPKKKTLNYQISGVPAVQEGFGAAASFADIVPQVTENNYIRTYTFEVRDVPPLKEEYLMPAPQDLAYSISISSLDSWDDLVAWYATLIREQDTITPEITEKTESLVRGAWSRKEKIKRLYEYVATNIQYLGYELGIWAIKPYPADFVLKVGKGDCKDKTTLLATMLSSVGIESYPVLISAGDTRGVNAHLPDGGTEVEAVPSLAYFNHMILAVAGDEPGEFIWLDPTAETCAFGDFPAGDQDRWTLIINPRFLTEGGTDSGSAGMDNRLYQFQKSPSLGAETNLKRVETAVEVREDRSVSVRQELRVTGVFNMKLRSQLSHLQTGEERAEFFHRALELDDRAKVMNVEVSGLSELKGELRVVVTWTCKEYLYAIGSQYVLELPVVKHPYAELLSEDRRMYAAVIGKALSLEDKVSVKVAAPFGVEMVPEAQHLETAVADIDIRYSMSKRKAEMDKVVRFLVPRVLPADIGSLKDVVRIASNRGPKRFILTQY